MIILSESLCAQQMTIDLRRLETLCINNTNSIINTNINNH